jgi:hypothetical protein
MSASAINGKSRRDLPLQSSPAAFLLRPFQMAGAELQFDLQIAGLAYK